VAIVSEERKLILQMVAEGKITPEEADKLLQAIDEAERAAQSAATETVQKSTEQKTTVGDLGDIIEQAVGDSLRGLDSTLRHLEIRLERKLNDPSRRELFDSIEEKVRRSVEKSVEKAARAEERAARTAERAAERAAEQAHRMAERMERLAQRHEHQHEHKRDLIHEHYRPAGGPPIIKMGVSIDKLSVERSESLSMPAQPGDRLVLENRVGDVEVVFCEGTAVEVDVKKQVWGEDTKDAEERAEATRVTLERRGSDVAVMVSRPHIVGVGVLLVKDTRIDYIVRVPYGTNLAISIKVGDLKVAARGPVSNWTLETKVGDVDLAVGPECGFYTTLQTSIGAISVDLANQTHFESDPRGQAQGKFLQGRIGEGGGNVSALAKTGEIRLHN